MLESATARDIKHDANPTQLSTRSYDEKRDYIRMKVNIEALVVNETGKKIIGFCHNLSGGGALLELQEALTVNEKIEVFIHSKHGHAPAFSSKGQVVRNQSMSEKSNYMIAVKY